MGLALNFRFLFFQADLTNNISTATGTIDMNDNQDEMISKNIVNKNTDIPQEDIRIPINVK